MSHDNRWRGLNDGARRRLETRSYQREPLATRLARDGAEARELTGGPTAELASAWIPGVEVFFRQVWPQRHRGWFAEFARRDDPSSTLTRLRLWPDQWATALMFPGTAKGFHIHPPHIPGGFTPERWFQRLFVDEPENFALRPYDLEQWDAMFFVQGIAEMFLVDERAGLPRRRMRFIIEGDNRPGPNNAGVIIPAGVAHAIQCAGSDNLIMVYGTSTRFIPENEGRISSEVERPPVPAAWRGYFDD
jgi:dTDP-4-dehydrorhamnose 3,5-epimerase-like enzyme